MSSIGPEGDRGAGLLGLLALVERGEGDAAAVRLAPHVTVAADLHLHADGQGVDDGGAHAVQAAGDRVAAAAELAAGVQHREHELDGGLALGGVHRHGDAARMVDDLHAAVVQQRHLDGVAVTGHRLVHAVVDDLLHHVVQAALTGRADVHARALAHRLEALEDGDVRGVVVLRRMRCALTGGLDRGCRCVRCLRRIGSVRSTPGGIRLRAWGGRCRSPDVAPRSPGIPRPRRASRVAAGHAERSGRLSTHAAHEESRAHTRVRHP